MIADDVPRRLTRGANRTLIERTDASFETRISLWNSPSGAAQAGGDWCDAFPISDHAAVLIIGDVAGHGYEVAPTMAAMRASILEGMNGTLVPSDVLAAANEAARAYGGDEGVMVTVIVAILNYRLATLTVANAGHPPPLMLTTEAHAFLSRLPADLPLGIVSKYAAADYVIALPADALVVFYTDGVTEHDCDPVSGEFELIAAARVVHGLPELNAARAIARRVFRMTRGSDDAAAIGLRTLPRSEASDR